MKKNVFKLIGLVYYTFPSLTTLKYGHHEILAISNPLSSVNCVHSIVHIILLSRGMGVSSKVLSD